MSFDSNKEGKLYDQDDPGLRTRHCRFFSSRRGCKLGDQCAFLHIEKNEAVKRERAPNATADISKAKQSNIENENPHDKGTADEERADDEASSRKAGVKTGSNASSKLCRFYAKSGRCPYGSRCKYDHIPSRRLKNGRGKPQNEGGDSKSQKATVRAPVKEDEETGVERSDVASADGPTEEAEKRPKKTQRRPKPQSSKPRRRLCRYFKAGNCNQGSNCNFLHPEEKSINGDADGERDIEVEDDKIEGQMMESGGDKTQPLTSNTRVKESAYPRVIPARASSVMIDSLTESQQLEMRSTEIQQLKKRYPAAEEITEDRTFYFAFSPSDPDWPYDVKEVGQIVSFSRKYPLKRMKVIIPERENMPDTLRRILSQSVQEWLESRYNEMQEAGKVELMFRPYLRWLDKNVEDIFTEGLKLYKKELLAKAAGIEIVSAAQLRERFQDETTDSSDSEEEVDDDEPDEGDYETPAEDDQDDSEDEEDEEEEEETPYYGPRPIVDNSGGGGDVARRGTEIKLTKLDLLENAATLLCTKVMLQIQCNRCKHRSDLSTPTKRHNLVDCARCSSPQLVTYRSSMAHQYSAVIGYLDLQDCTAFDVVLTSCQFSVGCFHCDKEMKMEGLHAGHVKETWCQHCHSKMRISTESVRLTALQPSDDMPDITSAHVVAVKKIKKVPKDPAIKEGNPLPEKGACKHYKKSFRWLRFPCCGKAYPCDICHDDKEDHEMKFANRMICGHCCKEQPFSAGKPCTACGNNMVKTFSEHWEGGKGCRDVIKMSRADSKKYASSNKTVSRKAQTKGTSGKKTTKIRHT